MQICVPVHSVVDVITNSSSVIYTEALGNSIAVMTEIINEILVMGESSKTADDLFDISNQLLPANGLDEWLRYEAEDEGDLPDNIAAIVKEMDSEQDYKAQAALATVLIEKHSSELFEYFNTKSGDCCDVPTVLNHLVIKTKAGVDTKFADRILSMFESEDYRDG